MRAEGARKHNPDIGIQLMQLPSSPPRESGFPGKMQGMIQMEQNKQWQ